MNSTPLFSVIVPTYQRNDLLAKCLERLAPGVQTLPFEQYEVIISDDGSEITAEEMIRDHYPWAKWVAGPRKGPAANRNNGAKYARGEWLVFTDDDCLPCPNWLKSYAEAATGSALALEGAIHPVGGDLSRDLAECPANLTGGCFWSANIAIQKCLFEKIGGFDPDYPLAAHEDQDLQLRLSPLTEILFVSDARVNHPVRIIPFKKAITRIPKRCAAWAHHVRKHKLAPNYGGNLGLTIYGYKFYLVLMLGDLYHFRFKSACVWFSFLSFGVPLVFLYLQFPNKYVKE